MAKIFRTFGFKGLENKIFKMIRYNVLGCENYCFSEFICFCESDQTACMLLEDFK